MEKKKSDVYTIWIDFIGIPDYKTRAKQAMKMIWYPYKYILPLKAEFSLWKSDDIFEKPMHKVYYILDHFILFPYYCVKAIVVGSVSKKRWEK